MKNAFYKRIADELKQAKQGITARELERELADIRQFGFAGTACVMNARRCGRRHCFYVGPLYLLAALASLLYGLNRLPLGADGWNWIMGSALTGTVLACCVLERLFGKYTAGH